MKATIFIRPLTEDEQRQVQAGLRANDAFSHNILMSRSAYKKEAPLVTEPSLTIPGSLYPAFAPLPIPIAEHLVLEEYRRYRRVPAAKQPRPEQLWARVSERVSKARQVVYEYMEPFVTVERKCRQQGLAGMLLSSDWLLDALAIYTPQSKRNAEVTLSYWQQRGLLRRDKPRGGFDLTSIAALLVARIAEEEHQRNWLPSQLAEEEPVFWCYSQARPDAAVQTLPIPLPPALPVTTVLWTPWLGAAWLSDDWSLIGKQAYRWAGPLSTLEELQVWDSDLATTIKTLQANALTSQEAVQATLIQEAGRISLERVACHISLERVACHSQTETSASDCLV